MNCSLFIVQCLAFNHEVWNYNFIIEKSFSWVILWEGMSCDFLRFRGTEIVKAIYFPTICLISSFGKILAVMQKIWLYVLIYNSFICLLGLLLSWERIHYFLCLQDVLHVLRWEVVSHCLQGDTTSNRCESNGVVYINCSSLFSSYDWNLFSSLLLFDNIASSVGSSRAVWGACWDGGC